MSAVHRPDLHGHRAVVDGGAAAGMALTALAERLAS